MRLKVAQECTPNMSLGKICYLHTCANNCESSFSRSASVNSLPILLFGGLFVWPIHCECLAFHLLIWMTPQSGYFGDLNQFLTEKHFWCCLQQNKKGFIFGTFSRNILKENTKLMFNTWHVLLNIESTSITLFNELAAYLFVANEPTSHYFLSLSLIVALNT